MPHLPSALGVGLNEVAGPALALRGNIGFKNLPYVILGILVCFHTIMYGLVYATLSVSTRRRVGVAGTALSYRAQAPRAQTDATTNCRHHLGSGHMHGLCSVLCLLSFITLLHLSLRASTPKHLRAAYDRAKPLTTQCGKCAIANLA
jgi:hypothetical protein